MSIACATSPAMHAAEQISPSWYFSSSVWSMRAVW